MTPASYLESRQDETLAQLLEFLRIPSISTVPISYLFKKHLGCDTVYFSFSTSDEQIQAPNEFFRLQRLGDGLAAWVEYWRVAGEGL